MEFKERVKSPLFYAIVKRYKPGRVTDYVPRFPFLGWQLHGAFAESSVKISYRPCTSSNATWQRQCSCHQNISKTEKREKEIALYNNDVNELILKFEGFMYDSFTLHAIPIHCEDTPTYYNDHDHVHCVKSVCVPSYSLLWILRNIFS